MQATSTVQMNTRIDGALKERGDRVLAALGLTPTQAVRGLWGYVVAHANEPETIRAVVGRGAPEGEDVSARLELLERGRALCAGLGALSPALAGRPYEELRDGAYADRYEAGLAGGDA